MKTFYPMKDQAARKGLLCDCALAQVSLLFAPGL